MESLKLNVYVFERLCGGPPKLIESNIWQSLFSKNYEDCVKSVEELRDVRYTNSNLYHKSMEYFLQEKDKMSKEIKKEWEIKNPRKILFKSDKYQEAPYFISKNEEIPYEELGLVLFDGKVYRKMDNGMPDSRIKYSQPREYKPTLEELYIEIQELRNEIQELRKEKLS